MSKITVSVVPSLAPGGAVVRSEGWWDLNMKLGPGGIVGAFDAWLAAHGMFDKYQWRYTSAGRPRGVARCIHVDTNPNVKPEALSNHLWDNLAGATTTHYSTALQRTVTQETSSSWETKLSISDTYTAEVGIEGGPLKAGAQNSVTVAAELGHSTSNTKSVTLGTTDEVSTDLPPGKADVVVLVAYVGTFDVVTTIQTAWEGSVEWSYDGGSWQKMDMQTLMDHGLARPCDPKGQHSGIAKVTTRFGVAGEVDQKVVAVQDTAPSSVTTAIQGAVEALAGESS